MSHDAQRQDQQSEDALLEQLRALASQLDGVPDDAVLAARSQLAHLRLDAELAELTFDSLLDATPAVAVRSETGPARRLTFEAGATQIELEVVPQGERRTLVGQCLPATEASLVVRRREAGGGADVTTIETATDELGRFTIEVPAGAVSLRCEWAHADLVVETTWVSV